MANGTALHPLVQRLAGERVLRCPRCGQPELAGDDAGLACAACYARFPSYTRVVDLYGLVVGSPLCATDLDKALALARPVVKAMDLPDSEAMVAEVATILERTALMSAHRDEFDAEVRDIADRFGIDAGLDQPPESAGPAPVAPETIDVRVERHYVPARLPPGARVTCNIRFRNQGTAPFSFRSAPPVHVGFRWFDADGRLVGMQEHRTRFPIDMAPGRAVTLPVEIDTPPDEADYTLVVCPVIEQRRWVPEGGLSVPVAIQSGVAVPDVLDLQPDSVQPLYAEEHAIARLMLEERAAYLLATPGRRILEIGGGASPQIAWFGPHDAVNVDINLPLLELGSLWYEHRAEEGLAERVAFLCADATNLPFESETFDIVAMFATLHHFAEPEVLLQECRRLIHPDGLVAVLCEPIGATLESAEILRDLSKGINEQIFTAPEYVAIFAAAGLEVIAGTQVGGSFRAFLRRSEPSGLSFTRVLPVPPTLVVNQRVGVDEPGPEPRLIDAPASLGLARRAQLRVKRALTGRR